MISEYHDKYDILHHKKVIDGDPETSENGPLYTGEELVAMELTNDPDLGQACRRFLKIVSQLRPNEKEWNTAVQLVNFWQSGSFSGINVKIVGKAKKTWLITELE